MFEDLEKAVNAQKERIDKLQIWLDQFKLVSGDLKELEYPWLDPNFIVDVGDVVPAISKIAAVDGGLISEAMSGFDLILYRSVGVVFQGIGDRVEAVYTPSFDPTTQIFFQPSLNSRMEFAKMATLYRLLSEYQCAIATIKAHNPSILFMDGSVNPLTTDFQYESEASDLLDMQIQVKETYRELMLLVRDSNIILCGAVKDSRSKQLLLQMSDNIPKWIRSKTIKPDAIRGWRESLIHMTDEIFANSFLERGQRTSLLTSILPSWLPNDSYQILTCMVKTVQDDYPIRFELISYEGIESKGIKLALNALYVLSNHGLPNAIPSIIIEADDRTKLHVDNLNVVVDHISSVLKIPKDLLRKRRNFKNT